MQHNIEREEKLIQLLGYHTVGPNASNRWVIMNKEENQVGYIQYKKIKKEHKKKGHPAIYGYITEIESEKIHYSACKEFNMEMLDYTFDIKCEDGTTDTVEMTLGVFPTINIWSHKYGYMSFSYNYRAMTCSFKSQTEHYNTSETIVVQVPLQNSYRHKQYCYDLTYCDKEKNIDKCQDSKTYSITVSEGSNLEVKDLRWSGDTLEHIVVSHVDGTILEAIQKHKMGLEAFRHFRYLINKVLPFQEEVITSLLQDCSITTPEYRLFLPELEMTLNHTLEEQNKQLSK